MGSLDLGQTLTAAFALVNLALLYDTRRRARIERLELKASSEAEFKAIVSAHETEVKTWRLQHEKEHAKFEATYATDRMNDREDQKDLRHQLNDKLDRDIATIRREVLSMETDIKDILKQRAGMK